MPSCLIKNIHIPVFFLAATFDKYTQYTGINAKHIAIHIL